MNKSINTPAKKIKLKFSHLQIVT